MKNRILAACVAALALAGCQKQSPPVPVSPPSRADSRPAHPTPSPAVATAARDSGMDFDEEVIVPQDVVALPYEHKGRVDHLARVKDLRSQGDLEGALAEARRGVFDNPYDEDALEQAAKIAKMVGKKDIAIEAFERLGRIRQEDPQPLLQEARLLVSKHDDDGAIEVAQEALIRDDQSTEAYQVKGRAHLHKGELPEAIAAFQRVLELDPSQGYAMNNLGFAYLRANENEKALEILNQAAEFLPDVAYVQNNLGVALERAGRLEEAKLAYAAATSLSPKYVKAQVNARRVKRTASANEQPTDPENGGTVDGRIADPVPSQDFDE